LVFILAEERSLVINEHDFIVIDDVELSFRSS